MLSSVRGDSSDRERTEQVLAPAPFKLGDTPILPVLDALDGALPFVAQGASQRGRAAQLFDKFGVGMEFVHGR